MSQPPRPSATTGRTGVQRGLRGASAITRRAALPATSQLAGALCVGLGVRHIVLGDVRTHPATPSNQAPGRVRATQTGMVHAPGSRFLCIWLHLRPSRTMSEPWSRGVGGPSESRNRPHRTPPREPCAVRLPSACGWWCAWWCGRARTVGAVRGAHPQADRYRAPHRTSGALYRGSAVGHQPTAMANQSAA
jgi:hypothetical protein